LHIDSDMNMNMKQVEQILLPQHKRGKNRHFGRPCLTNKNIVDRRDGEDARSHQKRAQRGHRRARKKNRIEHGGVAPSQLLLFPLDISNFTTMPKIQTAVM
jgi:hypothetical protein